MDNYYETCLATIKQAITDGNNALALEMLDEELRMPYIPNPYHDMFGALRDTLRVDKNPQSKYFDDIEDVMDALLGNDVLKHKGLISLERMNLRTVIADIERMLVHEAIDGWLKRQILLFLIDQEISQDLKVSIDGVVVTLNPKKLENPIGSKMYEDAMRYLVDTLESSNPSLLMLCVAELDQTMLENFPIQTELVTGSAVLERVNGYLNHN